MEEIELLKQIAAKPTFLQRLRLAPKPSDPAPIINPLLEKIAEKYFAPFVDVYAEESAASEEDKEVLKRELLGMLIENLCLLAGIPDQAQLALAVKIDPHLDAKKLKQYMSAAKIIFDVRDGKPLEFNPTVLYNPVGIQLIALGIQETALSIPLRFYDGPEDVTDRAEESLYTILTAIEAIRKTYRLKDVLELASSTSQLFRKIAQADDYVWLPLKPLITAPLADPELDLYARDNTDASHLANQIVRSDGVILITGYRGVGKSTFINQVLNKIEAAQGFQADDIQCKIIPIQMSVAKVSSVGGALRLCIRAIYRTFRSLEDQEQKKSSEKSHLPFHWKRAELLNDQEKQHLWFANLRASYKVSMSQAEALSQSRSLQGGLGLNPGDFFVGPVKTAVMAVVPTIGYRTSKDWNEKMDRTISLLDYDEDRAEEDIGLFIDMLAEPRVYEDKQVRIKLLFIFDEMDKMEARDGQDALIRSLKNLFLRRHAVFLLVTSKEFYYMLLEDRKKEDSILGSYFSSVITVPMFTSANTQILLENLLADKSGLSMQEQALISNLAKYFTYRAHGLPREVMREIRSMQCWAPRLLQSFLTDRSVQAGTIQLYAQIQDVIENLNSRTETDSGEKENLFMRERIWLSEGRQEQIRRGLYILVEELLNQGSFTVDLSTKFASYDSNFSTVAFADFYNVFDQLARKLAQIRLPDDQKTRYFERVASEATASSEPAAVQTGTGARSKNGRKGRVATGQEAAKPTAGKQVAIRVLPAFYTLTGRKIVRGERAGMDDPATEIRPEDVMQQVAELLEQNSSFLTRRALNHLSQHPNLAIPDGIQDKLFNLFISSRDLTFRVDAGKFLSSDGFYRNIGNRYPQAFLESETNETILKQFVDLTTNGAAVEDRKEDAVRILRELIDRNFERRNPLPMAVFQDALLDIETLISNHEPAAEEILRKVLKTRYLFDGDSAGTPIGRVEIPSSRLSVASLVPALVSLAKKAGTNLPMALLDHQSYIMLEQETLNGVVSSLSIEDSVLLWQKAMATRGSPASLSMLAAALSKLAGVLPKESGVLQAWLDGKEWSEWDKEVMRIAGKTNPKLFYKLEKHCGKDHASLAYKRLQNFQVSVQPEKEKLRSRYDAYAGLDQKELNAAVSGYSIENTIKLWQRAMATRGSPASASMLAAAVLKLAGAPPQESGVLQAWLDGEEWSEWDKEVLRIASKTDPRLPHALEKNFGKDTTSLAYRRLLSFHEDTGQKELKQLSEVRAADQSVVGYENPWWLNLLLGGAMLALFLYIPLDMLERPTLREWLTGRAFQFLGPMLILVAIGVVLMWFADTEPSSRKWYAAGILLSLGLAALMYWLLDRGGYPLTLRGELSLAAIALGMFLLPRLVQSILRWLMPRPTRIKTAIAK